MCLASSCCQQGVVAGCLNTESLDYLEREKRAASQTGPVPEPLQERAEQGQARPGKSLPDAQEAGWARFLLGHVNFLRPGHDLPHSRRVESEGSRVLKEPP